MSDEKRVERGVQHITMCAKCGKVFRGVPAQSREDPDVLICPDCGTREALRSIGVSDDECEEIIRIIHEHTPQAEEGERD